MSKLILALLLFLFLVLLVLLFFIISFTAALLIFARKDLKSPPAGAAGRDYLEGGLSSDRFEGDA